MSLFEPHGPSCTRSSAEAHESGQVVVLSALVIALVLAACVAVGLIGIALVDRTAATVAADAVAIADAVDPSAAHSLGSWYERHGYDVAANSGRARATGSHAHAASRAVATLELRVAPVVRAIIARAEQLLGRPLTVVAVEDLSVTLTDSSARHFAAIAAELGMCATEPTTFIRC